MASKKNKSKGASQVLTDSALTSLVIPRVPDTGYTKEKMRRATGAYQKIYNQISKKKNTGTQKDLKEEFSITDLEYRTLRSDASASRSALDEIIEELNDRTKELTDIINDKNESYELRFAAFMTRASLKRFLKTGEITFGGRANMRQLTHQKNVLDNAEANILKEEYELIALKNELTRLEDKTIYVKRRKKKIESCKKKIENTERRIEYLKNKLETGKDDIEQIKERMRSRKKHMPGVMGEANQKGNRFIKDIIITEHLKNNKKYISVTVVVKITNEEEQRILLYNVSKKQKDELSALWELAKKCRIPVTFYMTEDAFIFQYDKLKLNGTSIDKKSMIKEYSDLKKDNTKTDDEKAIERKEIYKKYNEEQNARMLKIPLPNGKAKIPGRVMSYDINPGEIGYCISELTKDGKLKIIALGRITFQEDLKHLNKKSSSADAKHQTNCLHTDISCAIKELFNIAAHYQCAESIREDLEFKIKIYDKFNPTESNYKNKNKWCRELIENLIHRRCAETGILDVIINPAYSSFIGGIQNRQFCDSTAAAVEIGRRGLNRYKNGSFYPQVRQEDVTTLLGVFKDTPDVELRVTKDVFLQKLLDINTSDSWITIYKSIRECFRNKADFEHRYRTTYKEAA